eukprot:COSAG04_NODE_10701_length_758_cov_0.866464_1_plen_44_part_00
MAVGGGESVVAQYKRQAEQIESLRAEFEVTIAINVQSTQFNSI